MKKYRYKMAHQHLTNAFIGKLTPVFNQEVTPGDTWSGRSTAVIRLAPLDVPTYMSLRIGVNFFFVPHRLTWPEFEDEITGADAPVWPQIQMESFPPTTQSWAQFGVAACQSAPYPAMNALPIRAYNKVWNDFYRPHLHINEVDLDTVQTQNVFFPESDYYGSIKTEIQQDTTETVDVSGGTLSVLDYRAAAMRQRLKERRSMYGERYRDMLLSDYGVRAPDSRIDRPEHLASGKSIIGISEVVATATSATENTGDYRGHGITGLQVRFPKRHFTEHGTIIGVLHARPRLQLRNRIDHQWLIQDKEDLYIPSLAADNMVTVNNREIYSPSGSGASIGYQDRHEHLRSARDTISGLYIGNAIYKAWSAAVDIDSVPTISYLQQVQEYDYLFQDQTANRVDLQCFFDHKIGKTSIIKPRVKR